MLPVSWESWAKKGHGAQGTGPMGMLPACSWVRRVFQAWKFKASKQQSVQTELKSILIIDTALYLSIFRINDKEKISFHHKAAHPGKRQADNPMIVMRLDLWGFRPVMFNQVREKCFYGCDHNAACLHGDPRPFGAGGSTVCPFAASSLEVAKERVGGIPCFPSFPILQPGASNAP